MKKAYRLDIGGRDEQQDSCGVFGKIHSTFLVLGDGMGGHKGGAIASQALLDRARVAYDIEAGHITNPQGFMQSIIDETTLALEAYRADHPDTDPQTTCVLALIQDGTLYTMHIGDSRVYILDERGYEWRTKDHSVVQMLLNLGEITEEEMGTHPDQNRLLKSLNSKKKVDGTFKTTPLPLGSSAVLVCSDGFWEYLSVEEMREYLFGMELDNALTKMVSLTKQRAGAGGDNISVAVAIQNTQAHKSQKSISPKCSMINSKLGGVIVLLLGIVALLAYLKYSAEPTVTIDKNATLESNTTTTETKPIPSNAKKPLVTEKTPVDTKENQTVKKPNPISKEESPERRNRSEEQKRSTNPTTQRSARATADERDHRRESSHTKEQTHPKESSHHEETNHPIENQGRRAMRIEFTGATEEKPTPEDTKRNDQKEHTLKRNGIESRYPTLNEIKTQAEKENVL